MSRRLFLLLIFLSALMLAGCSSTTIAPPSLEPTASAARWTPPDAPTGAPREEAAALIEALELCKAFASEMTAAYPGYAPVLSEEDVSYYERRLSTTETDLSSLTAELAQTIVDLRQQVYRKIENTSKMRNPLPEGLEDFVREFEDRFRAIGW